MIIRSLVWILHLNVKTWLIFLAVISQAFNTSMLYFLIASAIIRDGVQWKLFIVGVNVKRSVFWIFVSWWRFSFASCGLFRFLLYSISNLSVLPCLLATPSRILRLTASTSNLALWRRIISVTGVAGSRRLNRLNSVGLLCCDVLWSRLPLSFLSPASPFFASLFRLSPLLRHFLFLISSCLLFASSNQLPTHPSITSIALQRTTPSVNRILLPPSPSFFSQPKVNPGSDSNLCFPN